MSNVVKAIVAVDTGNRNVITKGMSKLFTDVFSVRSDVYELRNQQDIAKVYKIGVTLGAQCIVADSDYLRNPDALAEAINRTKRQVVEAIFGEFRPQIRSIEQALYNHNMEDAGRLLDQLERQMFEI